MDSKSRRLPHFVVELLSMIQLLWKHLKMNYYYYLLLPPPPSTSISFLQ